MVQKSTEKSLKLKEASKQQTFNAGVKDIEFWLGLLENQLNNNDYGKDLASVQNLIKKHQLIEADLQSHEEQINELNATGQQFLNNNLFDADKTRSTLGAINDRYGAIKERAQERKQRLNEAYLLHQFIRDLDDEDARIKEKRLLVKSEDYGRDLNSVQNLKKKHKRLEAELTTLEPTIESIREQAYKYQTQANTSSIHQEIEKKCEQLMNNWNELREAAKERHAKLDESLEYQLWLTSVDEERSWVNEKEHFISNKEYGDSLASVQGLLKKHDAFITDFNVHKQRTNELIGQAEGLINSGNYHSAQIIEAKNQLQTMIKKLEDAAGRRQDRLNDNWIYLQFLWKTDVVESWINEKQKQLQNADYGHNLSTVQNLLAKHDTFDAGLQAFQNEGIATTTALKDKLISSNHEQTANIQAKYDQVIRSWNNLIASSKQRRDKLTETLHKYKDIEELYLKFAKKASSFNSWFENAEEDLTDPVRCNSIEEIEELMKAHERFSSTLNAAQVEFDELKQLDDKIKALQIGPNPYTWFTMDTLKDTWKTLEKAIKDRFSDLNVEYRRQDENDQLRKQFASLANQFYSWLTQTRNEMIECVSGSLEDQLAATKLKSEQIRANKKQLKQVEDLSSKLEQRLILDNKYTEHSALSLAQAWDQLDQLGMRMQHNLEQQIQARNQSGVSESSLREFSMMFKHFDKEKTGRLDHDQFKSCLRALGYDLPINEQTQNDPVFNSILDIVDPNRDGFVNLQEFMAFMISRETENISSEDDVINAFKALTENSERPYITREELISVSIFLFFSKLLA